MMTRNSSPSLRIALVVMTVITVVTVAPARAQEPATAGDKASQSDPLNMLVLGDSIMWGQGLRDRDKFWWRVKNWLERKTGRRIQEKIEAHSGAAIEVSHSSEDMFTSKDGEVNLLTPTINEQVDDALRYYGDPARVDLILVNGCINDVDVHNLLDASTSLDSLEQSIKEKCGQRMQSLLTRIVRGFPRAHVVVTGYYRIVSPQSASNSFTRLLVKKLTSLRPAAGEISDKEMRERLVAISEKWYQVSTPSLAQAVAAVNSDLRKSGSGQRILFAEIEFSPEHAFSAPQTLLWNFKFGSTNLSGLRKAIVVLTLGTAAYKPDDEVRHSRSKSCKQTYKPPRDRRETKAEKERRELSDLACRYASLGHPNKMGALVYTESIKGQLQWLIADVGWLRKPSTLQPIPAN